MKYLFLSCVWVFIVGGVAVSPALGAGTEYFLAVDGDDGNDGLAETSAFATLQRGVDALQAGDTLTLLPGEYFGSARSEGLGDDRVTTRIRALIPGTAVVHGDVPAPEFTKLDGYRFVYAAPYSEPVHGVNELDSLQVLKETVSIGDVDVRPGSFYHDAEAGVLYVAPSGFESAAGKRFSICSIADHGLHMKEPRNVLIEGIDFRGFQQLGESSRHDRAGTTTWGLFISDGFRCVVQHCRAYFNNRGIGFNSEGVLRGAVAIETEIGYNVIQYCSAWANRTIYGWGGALNVFSPNRDQIRNSLAFLNGGIGIRMYQGNHYGLIYRNLAWGNGADFGLKAHASVTSLRNVGPGVWGADSVTRRVVHSLVGSISAIGEQHSNNIILHDGSATQDRPLYQDLDPAAEFADPYNKDYRLQATSRFRGAAEDGSDLGPFEFTPTVYFVSADGSDDADGLSTTSAWQSLAHAAGQLKAGDTLYIFPGEYAEDFNLSGITSTWQAPLTVRTHGAGAAVIHGEVTVADCAHVEIRNLDFRSPVAVTGGEAVVVTQSRFSGDGGGLRFDGVCRPRVVHNDFKLAAGAAVSITGGCGAFLSGNNFSRSAGVALAVEDVDAVQYANHNTYATGQAAWQVGSETFAADATPNRWETASVAVAPAAQPGAGTYGRLAGVYAVEPEIARLESKPELLVATATTANFEWYSASTGIFTVAWGTTPDTPNRAEVYGESFFTYSLTGLEPGTPYYFRLVSATTISRDADDEDYGSFLIEDAPLRFETAASDRPAKVFYVGPDGNDAASGSAPDQAWGTFFHAMTQLRPGDTLMVLEGDYTETLRLRTTGTEGAPITIRAAPGATVIFDSEGRIPNYFIVDYKDWIHLDGFYMRSVSRLSSSILFAGAGIRARSSANLTISRCMMDGRMIAYSGPLLAAYQCRNLLLENSVQIDNMGPARIIDCPNVRIANCVFLRSKISPIEIVNRPGDIATLENSIFTDTLVKKGNSLLINVGYYPMLRTYNNGYFFRRPGDERPLMGLYGEVAYERSAVGFHIRGREDDPPHPITDEVVVRSTPVDWHTNRFTDGDYIEGDPLFAIVAANIDTVEELRGRVLEHVPLWQTFDWIASGPQRSVPLSFADLFATNPEFLERDIGLQPEAFTRNTD